MKYFPCKYQDHGSILITHVKMPGMVAETLIQALGKQILEAPQLVKLPRFVYSRLINDITSNEVNIIPKNDI